jgi:hypothetical protein
MWMPGGGCCPSSAIQYCCIACICLCINAIIAPWDFTDSCMAAYAAPKLVCDRLPVQCDGVIVIHGGHPLAMHDCGDGGLVQEGDLAWQLKTF